MLIGNMYILLLLMVALATLDASQNYNVSTVVQSWLVKGIVPNREPLKFETNSLKKNVLLDKETGKFID